MGDVHGVVAIDEEQYAAWRAANEAEDPAGGTPAQNGGHQGEGGAFALAHAGASGAGPSWGGDSWQAAAVAGAGNGALVHQPQYGAGDAGSGGQNVVIPADLVANMLERLQSAEQRNAALEQRLAVMEKANALAHGRQFPPFDPTAEIKRVAIKNAKPGYSPIVIFGRMVWVTGIVALNTVNQDVEHQTNQALEHMKTLLHKAGTNTRHLLKVNIYLSDIRTVDACHRAWEQFFAAQAMGDEERPCASPTRRCSKNNRTGSRCTPRQCCQRTSEMETRRETRDARRAIPETRRESTGPRGPRGVRGVRGARRERAQETPAAGLVKSHTQSTRILTTIIRRRR